MDGHLLSPTTKYFFKKRFPGDWGRFLHYIGGIARVHVLGDQDQKEEGQGEEETWV
jgi:hypothetical protein